MVIKVNDGEPTELCEIALKHRADKCPQICHHYTRFYYDLLKDKRESVKKVFEMGIGNPEEMHKVANYKTGASLYMWRDFFPNAQIYGADIRPESIFQEDRINTFLCDERKISDIVNVVREVGPDIDLFIDDALHGPGDQVFLCLNILPLLKRDVIYVIEDIPDPGAIERYLGDYQYDNIRFNGKRFNHERLIVIYNKSR